MVEKEILQELHSIKTILSEQNINRKDVLNFNEAVKFIDVSSSYLYKLTSSGKIPHYKPQGKKIFFSRVELEAWLLTNPVTSSDAIEIKASTHVALNGDRK